MLCYQGGYIFGGNSSYKWYIFVAKVGPTKGICFNFFLEKIGYTKVYLKKSSHKGALENKKIPQWMSFKISYHKQCLKISSHTGHLLK